MHYFIQISLLVLLFCVRSSNFVHFQPGYIHPDEFFQTLEVASKDVLNLTVYDAWEFKNPPLRSKAAMFPFVYLPISLSNWLSSPYSRLNVKVVSSTRLFFSFLSLINDAFVFHLSKRHSKFLALLLYASTVHGGLLFATRTLTNSLECMFVSAFCLLAMRRTTVISVFCQGVLLAWATFLRPTFAVFVFVPALIQFAALLKSKTSLLSLVGILLAGVCSVGVTAACLITADTYLYDFGETVITPVNFIRYNTKHSNLAEHGLHPWFVHLLVNIPLVIFNPVAASLLYAPSRSSLSTFASFLFPILVLSFFPHQEARFLTPIIPFAVSLLADRLTHWWLNRSHVKLVVFAAFHLLHEVLSFAFWGYLHQAGLLQYLASVSPEMTVCEAFVFYRTFMPPRFFFGQPRNSSFAQGICGKVVDLAGSTDTTIGQMIASLLEDAKKNANTTSNFFLNIVHPCHSQVDISALKGVVETQRFSSNLNMEHLAEFKGDLLAFLAELREGMFLCVDRFQFRVDAE